MSTPRNPARLITFADRPVLRFDWTLEHPTGSVWKAVSKPSELGQWFPSPVSWEPVLNETIAIDDVDGLITELINGQLLSWTVGPEYYRIEITPEPHGCTLVFMHGFDPQVASAAEYAAGWEAYLARLCSHLDGGFLSENQAIEQTTSKLSLYQRIFADQSIEAPIEDSVTPPLGENTGPGDRLHP
jgi:Activator of Hsp90 ATPase homolog 1-like protein